MYWISFLNKFYTYRVNKGLKGKKSMLIKSVMIAILFVVSPIWPIGENPLVGDPLLIVNKKTNQLAYIHEGAVQKVYPVATGLSRELTPEGKFTIIVKAVNPYYRKKNIEGGTPENPLGSRWIGFDAKGTDGRTYGVHGNNNPDSVGKYITQGCIRMHEEDVQELYNKIPIGTKIVVVTTEKSFEALGKEFGGIAK